jgi:activating signal cointegrator 1
MRAITLHHPWANLCAHGIKTYETRSWKTGYKGLLLIHAGQRVPKLGEVSRIRDYVIHPDVKRATSDLDETLGCIVAIATLSECVQMTESLLHSIGETEFHCGNWEIGRYAWKLENTQRIRPIPAKGKQCLWIPSPEVIAEVSRYINVKSA